MPVATRKHNSRERLIPSGPALSRGRLGDRAVAMIIRVKVIGGNPGAPSAAPATRLHDPQIVCYASGVDDGVALGRDRPRGDGSVATIARFGSRRDESGERLRKLMLRSTRARL